MNKSRKQFICRFIAVIGLCLCAGGVPAADKKVPVLPLSDSNAVTRVMATKPSANIGQDITDSKAALEMINVAQYRLSQTISKMEGKKAALPQIPSTLEESEQVLNILDTGIASLSEADDKAQHAARHLNNTEAQTQKLYWRAYAARQTERQLIRLIDKTSNILASSIPDKNRKASETTITSKQRSELLKVLSELNQLHKNNQQRISQLSTAIANKPGQPLVLPISNQPLSVPKLAIYQQALEQQTLNHFLMPNKPAMKSTDKKPADSLVGSSRNKIDLLTPGISHKWTVNNAFNTTNWLSTGKYLAFDVFNQLDKKQREKNLKQKMPDINDKPMLGAAVLARLHIAYNLYQDRLEKFQLSACLQNLNERLHTLEQQQKTYADIIEELRAEINSVRTTLRYYDFYSELRHAFSLLKTSFDSNMQTLQPFNQSQCFQPKQLEPAIFQKPEPVEPAKVEVKPLATAPAPKPVVKSKPKTQWIADQKASAFTLQIMSGKEKRRLSNYVRRHKLGKNAHITTLRIKGRISYALHYGLYGDRERAFIAQFKLPLQVQSDNQIWIRRIGDIQKTLK